MEYLEYFINHYGSSAIFNGCFLEGETILLVGGFTAHRGFGVASLGLPQVIQVTKAVVTDREATFGRFQLPSDSRPAVETVLADGGSTENRLATGVCDILGGQVDMANRAELHPVAVIPKRWGVERSCGWED